MKETAHTNRQTDRQRNLQESRTNTIPKHTFANFNFKEINNTSIHSYELSYNIITPAL